MYPDHRQTTTSKSTVTSCGRHVWSSWPLRVRTQRRRNQSSHVSFSLLKTISSRLSFWHILNYLRVREAVNGNNGVFIYQRKNYILLFCILVVYEDIQLLIWFWWLQNDPLQLAILTWSMRTKLKGDLWTFNRCFNYVFSHFAILLFI